MRVVSLRGVEVTRVAGESTATRSDEVAVEEPLDIRISGDTFAVTMRTPGHDRELVLGLLFAEGVIASVGDIGSISHCGRTGSEARANTIEVTSAPGRPLEVPELVGRRGTLTTSACGVCGRRSVEDMVARCAPIPDGPSLPAERLVAAVERLGESQPLFSRTGGCHAAVLVSFTGERVVSFEDVGRHNAVDKVVGAMLLQRRVPLWEHVLVVSGRSSFEIVQKAALAGIPVVASVSAPSSLAIDLARRTNITLVGFARGSAFNLYSSFGRIADPDRPVVTVSE